VGLVLCFGGGSDVLADPPAGTETAASATPSPSEAPASLPQQSFLSSLKQAFNKDFDREVVRGHFDLGSPPNAHRYYCLIDPKTGKKEPNGVLGQPVALADGMTGVTAGSVSLYRCDDAEKQRILVTAGYIVSKGAGSVVAPAPQPQTQTQAQTQLRQRHKFRRRYRYRHWHRRRHRHWRRHKSQLPLCPTHHRTRLMSPA